MDRISRKQIVKDNVEGGCRMIHLLSFFKIIKSLMDKKAYEHKCSLDRAIFRYI